MGAEVEKNLTPGYQTGAKFDKKTWKAQTLFDAQRVKYKVAQTAEPLSRNRFLIIHIRCSLRNFEKYDGKLNCVNRNLLFELERGIRVWSTLGMHIEQDFSRFFDD